MRRAKSRKIKVVPICSHCQEEVSATTKDLAYRHGFKRFKTTITSKHRKFSQEDGRACEGSGKPVIYRRRTTTKKRKI